MKRPKMPATCRCDTPASEFELDYLLQEDEFEAEMDFEADWEDELEGYVGSRRRPRYSRNYMRWIQYSINQVSGRCVLKVDGIIGPNTRGAIRRFQRSRRLSATGKMNRRTVKALVSAGACRPPRAYTSSSTYTSPNTGNTAIIDSNYANNSGNSVISDSANDDSSISVLSGNDVSGNDIFSGNTFLSGNTLDTSGIAEAAKTLTSIPGTILDAGKWLLDKLKNREFELEMEFEMELGHVVELTSEQKRDVNGQMKALAMAAATAETEAESEALIGSMIPLSAQLFPRAKPMMLKSSPAMTAGLKAATQLLHRDPRTRPLLKTMPTVLGRTAAVLNQASLRGHKPSTKSVVKVLANQAAKVMSDPRQARRALRGR